MNKSPEFDVIERVLHRAADSEEQLEQSWIDHYISLADRLLRHSARNAAPDNTTPDQAIGFKNAA